MLDLMVALVVIVCLSGAVVGSNFLKERNLIGREASRKVVHLLMGLICMSFPWVFSSVLPVQVLGVVVAGGIVLLKRSEARESFGSALFSVKRVSVGVLLFPLAVAWLFTLAFERPILYVIPLLLLTFGDAFGALVGTRYGKRHYQTLSGMKSIEGSVTFFVISLISTFLPLYLTIDYSWTHLLLVSVAVSLIATLLEGGASHGMDNLFIPIATFLILDYYLERTEDELVLRLVILVVLGTLLIGTRRIHTFDGAGVIGCILFGFGAYTLGGLACLLSTFILFFRYLYVSYKFQLNGSILHTLFVIFYVAVVPLSWLTLGRTGAIAYESAQQGAILSLASIGLMTSVGTVVFMELSLKHLLKPVLLYVGIALPLYLFQGFHFSYLVPFAFSLLSGVVVFFIRKNTSGSGYWASIALLALTQSIILNI